MTPLMRDHYSTRQSPCPDEPSGQARRRLEKPGPVQQQECPDAVEFERTAPESQSLPSRRSTVKSGRVCSWLRALLRCAEDQWRSAPAIRHTALTVAIQEYGKTLVLVVDGVVDLHTAPTLRQALAAALSRGPRRLVVDLSLVRFLNSAGLEVLLAAHLQAAPRTDLRLVATTRATWRPLQITKLHEQLIIHTSRAQAIAAPTRRRMAPS